MVAASRLARDLVDKHTVRHNDVDFFNMTTMLSNKLFRDNVLAEFQRILMKKFPTASYIAVFDSRGYLLIPNCSIPLVCITKGGKLPAHMVHTVEYGMEYREKSVLEIDMNILSKGSKVVFIDDVVATGGSIRAGIELIEKCGAEYLGTLCVLDLGMNHGLKNVNSIYNTKTKCQKFVPNASIDMDFPSDHIVMASPPVENLAQTVDYQFMPCNFNKFPDGTDDIHFFSKLENKTVHIFISMTPEYRSQELNLIQVISRQFNIRKVNIYVPYLPSATMERVDVDGVIASAEVDMRLISNIPMTSNGLVSIHYVDLHAPIERFYNRDTTHFVHHTCIEHFAKKIANRRVVLVYPDQGSYKRFGCLKCLKDYPHIICSKIRNGDKREITIENYVVPEGFDMNTNDTEFFIVDDLIHSGGTLIETAKMFILKGYTNIFAVVTHFVGENNSFMKILSEDSPFKEVWFTDSIPINAARAAAFSKKAIIYTSVINAIGLPRRKYDGDIDVYVPTNNETKALGVYLYYLRKNIVANIFMVPDIQSEVKEQPFNHHTFVGAYNRYFNTKTLIGSDKIIVSVENGILLYNHTYYETAVMFINGFYLTYTYGEVKGLYIANLHGLTYGKYLAIKFGMDPSDWHNRVFGVSREVGISKCFKNDDLYRMFSETVMAVLDPSYSN